MKTARLIGSVLATCLVLISTDGVAAGRLASVDRDALRAGMTAVEGSWLFVFEDEAAGERALQSFRLAGHACTRLREIPRVVPVSGLTESQVEMLRGLPGLASIQPDVLVPLALTQSVPLIEASPDQLTDAGFAGLDGEGVRVCVIDSGVRASHEMLAGRVDVAAGSNPKDGNADSDDTDGHGTHVASIIAGVLTDSAGAGVAPGATIVPVRACDSRSCPESALIAAVDHCVDPDGGNADVLNLSLGGPAGGSSCSETFDALGVALAAAIDQGKAVVAAAGNSSVTNGVDWPACQPRVIAVGAVYDRSFASPTAPQFPACGSDNVDATEPDQRICFSNGGPDLDLMAPGGPSFAADATSDTALATYYGTSMATPHVAGLIALMLQAVPSSTPAQVRQALIDGAIDTGEPGFDPLHGFGRVSTAASLPLLLACPDGDADLVCDDVDNCPATANFEQADADGDGSGDACDGCPEDAGKTEPGDCGCGRVDRDADNNGQADCLQCVWGDVHPSTGNLEVTLADFVVARRLALGETEAVNSQAACGDVAPTLASCPTAANPTPTCPVGDGSLTVDDAVLVRQGVAGSLTFNCEPCPSNAPEEVSGLRLPGDVAPPEQPDDKVDVTDVIVLLNIAVGALEATDEQALLGDISPTTPNLDGDEGDSVAVGDDHVDVSDVITALRVAVGSETVVWPRHELALSSDSEVADVEAVWITLAGWPAWASAPLAASESCGEAGGADLAADSAVLICAPDDGPLTLPSELPGLSYRAPEPLQAEFLEASLLAMTSDLTEVPALISVLPR